MERIGEKEHDRVASDMIADQKGTMRIFCTHVSVHTPFLTLFQLSLLLAAQHTQSRAIVQLAKNVVHVALHLLVQFVILAGQLSRLFAQCFQVIL